jgi:hypothetical protein
VSCLILVNPKVSDVRSMRPVHVRREELLGCMMMGEAPSVDFVSSFLDPCDAIAER